MSAIQRPRQPGFGEAFKVWLKIGCLVSAGRPARSP